MASNSSALPRVTFQTPEKPGEESSHRKLGKLTIKYNRKDLQRWLDLEEWINSQLQELYQCRVSSWGKPAPRSSGGWDWRPCVLGQKVACSALLEIASHLQSSLGSLLPLATALSDWGVRSQRSLHRYNPTSFKLPSFVPAGGCSYCSARVAEPREIYTPGMLLAAELHVVSGSAASSIYASWVGVISVPLFLSVTTV